jgi:hypothetical protein
MLLADTLRQVWPKGCVDIEPVIWPYFAHPSGEVGQTPARLPDPLQTPHVFNRIWCSTPPEDPRHVSKDAILRIVQDTACRATAHNDMILVFFAGHGTVLDDNASLLLPAALSGTGVTALSISEICKAVEAARSPSRNRVMILDCCLDFSSLNSLVEFLKGTDYNWRSRADRAPGVDELRSPPGSCGSSNPAAGSMHSSAGIWNGAG